MKWAGPVVSWVHQLKRTDVGCRLWLDLRTRKRIHALAHDHGTDQEGMFRTEGFGNDCDLGKNLQSPILFPLKSKGITESLRNRRELREHRVHESDYRVIGARLRQRSERGEERCRPAYQAKVSILQCLNVV